MKIVSHHPLALAAALLVSVGGLGCAGQLEHPELFTKDDTAVSEGGVTDAAHQTTSEVCDAQPIIKAKCIGCHTTKSPQGDLDLESAGFETKLVGKMSSAAQMCAGREIISSTPETSLLYMKLQKTPGCGSPMPFGSALDPVTEIPCFSSWIAGLIAAKSGTGVSMDGGAGGATQEAGGMTTMPNPTPNDSGGGGTSAMDAGTMTIAKTGPLDRSMWVASASDVDAQGAAANAIDSDTTTRFSSGKPMVTGMTFTVDMKTPQTFKTIVMDSGTFATDYARGYDVMLGNDVATLTKATSGTGSAALITVTLTTAQTARYIRIVQTGSDPTAWWSITDFSASN